MTINILILARSYPVNGGVELWLNDLVKGILNDPNYSLTIRLMRGIEFHNPEKFMSTYEGLPYACPIDGRGSSLKEKVNAIADIIIKNKPDIVIPILVHEVLIALDNLAGTKPKVIYPIHEYSPFVIKDVECYHHIFTRVVCCEKLSILVLNEMTACPSEKIAAIPHGVFIPEKSQSSDDRKLRVGLIGRLDHSSKNVLQLTTLCKILDVKGVDYKIEICGSGPDENELKEKLSYLVEKNKVIFHGWLSREFLYKSIYPNLDVLLLMSPRETGPMVAWEAMMHGVIPVVSRYIGLTQGNILKHGHNAMVFPVNEMTLAANALVELVLNPKLRNRLADNARKTAESEKSYDSMVKQWKMLFNEIYSHKCTETNVSLDFSRLPKPEGRLDKTPIPKLLKRLIRRIRSVKLNMSAQSEWAFFHPVDREYRENYDRILRRLDQTDD